MARRTRKSAWSQSVNKVLKTMTQTALRVGTKALKESLCAAPRVVKPAADKIPRANANQWTTSIAIGAAGPRRYRLYKPPGVRKTESLPLLVMLHGCGQDADALAPHLRSTAAIACWIGNSSSLLK
jgi:poly(3-hydroxybutyrate) depolymerase